MSHLKEPKGSMHIVDLWADKNIKSFLGSYSLLRDKLILSKIA